MTPGSDTDTKRNAANTLTTPSEPPLPRFVPGKAPASECAPARAPLAPWRRPRHTHGRTLSLLQPQSGTARPEMEQKRGFNSAESNFVYSPFMSILLFS